MALHNTTVLITGGLGHIGLALTAHLLQAYPSARLHILDLHLPPSHLSESSSPNLSLTPTPTTPTYHAGSITNAPAVRAVLEAAKPQVIFHAAALIPGASGQREEAYERVNVEGTRVVLGEAGRVGGVMAFVFVSSADVVKVDCWGHLRGVKEGGEAEMEVVCDDGAYGGSKTRAEHLVLMANSPSLPTTAIRTHAVFSAHDANLLPRILSAPRFLRFGPGTNLYDFTYAPNLAFALCLAAENLLSTNKNPTNEESEREGDMLREEGGMNERTIEEKETAAGKAFFVTNGEPVPFKNFVSWVWDAQDSLSVSQSSTSVPSSAPHITQIPLPVAQALVWAIERVAWLIGKRPALSMGELGDSACDRWFDNGRARSVLGYVPRIGVREGVWEAVRGMRER